MTCLSVAAEFGIPVEKRLWYTAKGAYPMDADKAVNCATIPELIAQLPKI